MKIENDDTTHISLDEDIDSDVVVFGFLAGSPVNLLLSITAAATYIRSMIYKRHPREESRPNLGCVSYCLLVKCHKNT